MSTEVCCVLNNALTNTQGEIFNFFTNMHAQRLVTLEINAKW